MTADDDKRRHTVKMAPPSSRAQRDATEAYETTDDLDPDGPTQRPDSAAKLPQAKRRLQGQLLAGLVCTDDDDLGAFRRLRLGLDATVSDTQLALLREHLRLAALALHDPDDTFWQGLEVFGDPVDEPTPPESRTDPQLRTDPFLRLPKPSPPRRPSSVPPSGDSDGLTRSPDETDDQEDSPSTERTPAVIQDDPSHGYGYGQAPAHSFPTGTNPASTMAMTPAGGAPAMSSHTPLEGVQSAHGGIPMSAPVPSSGIASQPAPAPEAPPSGSGEDDPWVRPWAPQGQPAAPVDASAPRPPPHHDGYPAPGQDPSYDAIPPYHDADPSYDAIPPVADREPSFDAVPPAHAPPPGAPPPGAPPPGTAHGYPPPGAPPPGAAQGYPPPARRTDPGIAPPNDAYPAASPSEPTYPQRSSYPEASPPPAAVQPEPEAAALDPIISHAHGLALSVDEYAALCAERDHFGPQALEATQARYDVHSPAAWESTRQAFALRFSRDPGLRHQWEHAYYRFTAFLRNRR